MQQNSAVEQQAQRLFQHDAQFEAEGEAFKKAREKHTFAFSELIKKNPDNPKAVSEGGKALNQALITRVKEIAEDGWR